MKIIKAEKQTGAKRLHRKYALENAGDFKFSQEHEVIDGCIEFESKYEGIFLEEVYDFSEKQKEKQIKELRNKQKIDVVDAQGEQGTEEWLNSRLGIITASETPFTIKGTKIPTFDTYVYNKVAEKVRQDLGLKPLYTPTNQAMELGKELEHLAIERYEKITGMSGQTKGLVVGVDSMIGASVDGVTTDDDFNKINIEVKTVSISRYLAQMHSKSLSKEYYAQMQVQMFIMDIDVTHFLVQCSETDKLDLLIDEVPRDEEFIYNLIQTLKDFESMFNEVYKQVRL